MVVDAHAHVFADRSWAPEWFWRSYVRVLAINVGRTVAEVERDVLPSLWDPDGARIVAQMDAAGIERAFVLTLDWELAREGERAALSIDQLHRRTAAIVAAHPGRLVYGVGVDPRRTDAVALLRRGVQELGAKVLKLYPPAGFYPSDRIVYPLYEACVELGIPVLLHCGPAVAPFRSRFGQPVHLDDVATDFPELTIIAGHAGHGWWIDALAIARSKFNIVLEVSGWALLAAHPARIYEPLRNLLDVLPGRVMFGSDYIGLPGSLARTAKLFTALPDAARAHRVEFQQKEIDELLAGTARRVFKLDGLAP